MIEIIKPENLLLSKVKVRYSDYITQSVQKYKFKRISTDAVDYIGRQFIYVVRDGKIIDILYTPFDNDRDNTSGISIVFCSSSYDQQYSFSEWMPDGINLQEFHNVQTIIDMFTTKEWFAMGVSNSVDSTNALYAVRQFIEKFRKLYNFLYSSKLWVERSKTKYQLASISLSIIQYYCTNVIEIFNHFYDMDGLNSYFGYLSKFYDNLERNFPDDIEEINVLRQKLIIAKITN